MKIFSCSKCHQVVFFENVRCTRCGTALAYLPDRRIISDMEPAEAGMGLVATAPGAERGLYRLCRNSNDHGVCNWAVPASDDDPYCSGCRLNDVIPNLTRQGALVAWGRLEHAKKRLLYTLFALGLPVDSYRQKKGGLVFSFKENEPMSPVLTGHDDGHITLNIAEADNPSREKLREQLGETYRTLVGHFRHEIGHYYWDVLVRDTERLGPFRDLFGDHGRSYEAELERHYREGPPANWRDSFVSTYATMHPWEDWAETFAHYLHIVDTLETARSYGMELEPHPSGLARSPRELRVNASGLDFADFDDLIGAWFPLTFALNSLNRGMGLPDIYPFVLSERAIEKLRFVHHVVDGARTAAAATPSESASGAGRAGSSAPMSKGPD